MNSSFISFSFKSSKFIFTDIQKISLLFTDELIFM